VQGTPPIKKEPFYRRLERTGCGDASACLSVVDAPRWRRTAL